MIVEVFERTPQVDNGDLNFGCSHRSHVDHIYNALKTLVLYSVEGTFTAYAVVRHAEYAQVCSRWQIEVQSVSDPLGKQLRLLPEGALINIDGREHVLVAANGGNIPSIEKCKNMLMFAVCKEVLKSSETDISTLRQNELLRLSGYLQAHKVKADNLFRCYKQGRDNVLYMREHYKHPTVPVHSRLRKLAKCGLIEDHEQPMTFPEYEPKVTAMSQYAELLRWQSYVDYLLNSLEQLIKVRNVPKQ